MIHIKAIKYDIDHGSFLIYHFQTYKLYFQ